MSAGRPRRAFLRARPDAMRRAALDPEESHHLVRVLRLREGDALAVFDGRGGEWDARAVEVARDRVIVELGEARSGVFDPELRVVLVQALARPEKIEWVLQKGTEVGIAAFRLFASARAEVPPPSEARIERYRRVVLEACKQCGRRHVPPLDLGEAGDPPAGGPGVLLDPSPDAVPLGEILSGPPRPEVALAVGPEGGLSEGEAAAMSARGWRRARLGPRVLRTETAGAVAAALVLFAWGDLGLR